MEEVQLDAYMVQIQQDIDILRALQKRPVVLTESQKDYLEKLEKQKRTEKEKEFLKKNKEEKLSRNMLLIYELEDKIRAAGLPAEATARLLAIIQQAKDNNWKFSPDALDKLEKAKQEEHAKEQRKQEKDHADDGDIIISAAAAGIAATAVASAIVAKEAQKAATKDFTGPKFASEQEKAEYKQKLVESIAKRTTAILEEETGKKEEEISLVDIWSSKMMNNMQKKVAEQNYYTQHQEEKRQKEIAEKIETEKSIARAERKFAENQARKSGIKLPKQENQRPEYTKNKEDYEFYKKKIKPIKEEFGLRNNDIKEICEHLSREDKDAYNAWVRKYNPEYFVSQKEETKQKQQQQTQEKGKAKTSLSEEQEAARLALKKRLEERRALHRQQIIEGKTDSLQDRTVQQESRTVRPEETQIKAERSERKRPSKTETARKQPGRVAQLAKQIKKTMQSKIDLRSHLKNSATKNHTVREHLRTIEKRDYTAKGIAMSAVNKRRKGY